MKKVVNLQQKRTEKHIANQLDKLEKCDKNFLNKLSLLQSDGKYSVKELEKAWDNLYYMVLNGELDKIMI